MNAAGPHTNTEDELQHSQNAAEGYRAAADEHAQTLKDFWKHFMVSGLFVVAALVIILACVAWFLNNSQVKANGIDTSTAGARYAISSDGTQQGAYDQEVLEILLSGLIFSAAMPLWLSASPVTSPGPMTVKLALQ